MKTNRKTRPRRFIYEGYENTMNDRTYLDFYIDIVNKRNMDPKDFFRYLRDRYSIAGDYQINNKIETISYNYSTSKGNIIKTIIDYKKACLNNEEDIELKNKFDKIKDIVYSTDKIKTTKRVKEKDRKKEEKDIATLKKELNEDVDKYLSGEEIDYCRLRYRVNNNINLIDKDKYISFIIKSLNISAVENNSLDDLIKVLNYYIFNLKNNLWEMQLNEYVLSTRSKEIKVLKRKIELRRKNIENNFYEDDSSLKEAKDEINKYSNSINEINKIIENYTNKVSEFSVSNEEKYELPIMRECSIKVKKIEYLIKEYNIVLEEILKFKKLLSENSKDLSKFRFSDSKIDSSFIKEYLSELKNFLYGYRHISKRIIKDQDIENLKENYIKRLYIG